MKKRTLFLKTVSVLACVLTAGNLLCVGVSAEEKEPVNLRFMWWGGDERNEATVEVIDMFEEKYPWITIEPEFSGGDGYQEKLATALAGGQAADIIQNGSGWLPGFAEKGDFFIDFNEYQDQIDLSGLSTELLGKGTYNGKLLGLPSGAATGALLVNKTLADEIGLDFSNLTWEKLLELGKQTQAYDENIYLLNVDTAYLWTHVFRIYEKQLTGKILIDNDTKTVNYSEEELTEALSYIQKLFEEGAVQPAGETASFDGATQTNPKWINSEIVCALTDSSKIVNMTSVNENAEFMVVELPKLSDDQVNDGYSVGPPQIYCINKDSDHIEESLLFLDYVLNDEEAAEVLKDVRSVPPTEKARKICEEKGLIDSLVTQAVEFAIDKNGVKDTGLATDVEIEAVGKDMIDSVIYGNASPEEAASSALQLIGGILEDR